jgi:hypothetical protein
VVGENHPDPTVTVLEVVWPPDSGSLALPRNNQILLTQLPQLGAAQHWEGPGEYILPLTQMKNIQMRDERFSLTPIPRSPGYPPRSKKVSEEALREEFLRRLPIYPKTSRTLQQLNVLKQARQSSVTEP